MNQSTIPQKSKNQDSSPIKIEHQTESRIQSVDLDNPGFGNVFADHMLNITYKNNQWQQPLIEPFRELSLSPATATIHYGQTVFEGMKAFRGQNGEVKIFRLHDHLNRLNNSCSRMCIPQLDTELLSRALKKLITIDRKWVPEKYGNALYIRPIIFATDASLGVKPAKTYQLLVITSPVGAYYDEGFDPVNLTTTDEYIRATEGGSGYVKTACNYGPTLLPAQKAKEKGFTQILWLDAHEHKYIEEVGTMNIFFKIDGELHTPPLDGSILGGITRDSVIRLASQWDIPVHQRRITINEIFEADHNNKLEEIFGTGTAAVISPVGSIHHNGKTIVTDREQIGPFAQKLYETITGIQYSTLEDTNQWMSSID
ncbi:branched-chain amino acid aminotransferase [Fodinibius sp. Rm-B-1B1-1]|uniref:branched-chain amino acid aminotransferase n=1 Tax=Fodinibius alkaliphilus TaxID=3140241 RepID=UPI00315A4F45